MKNVTNLKEKRTAKTIEDRFNEITATLRRSVDGVLKTGRLIYEASNQTGMDLLSEMLVRHKVLAKSTISQYRTIGGCGAIHTADIEAQLPASFNSIYHLAKLESDHPGFLRRYINSGKLNASTTLENIRSWGSDRSLNGEAWATISVEVDGKLSSAQRKAVKQKLIQFLRNEKVPVKDQGSRSSKSSSKGARK